MDDLAKALDTIGLLYDSVIDASHRSQALQSLAKHSARNRSAMGPHIERVNRIGNLLASAEQRRRLFCTSSRLHSIWSRFSRAGLQCAARERRRNTEHDAPSASRRSFDTAVDHCGPFAMSRDARRQRTLCTEGFNRFVTSTVASIATGWSDPCRAGFAPAGKQRLGTAHPELRF